MRNLYQTWEIEINAEREIETKRVGEKAEGERRLFVCLFVCFKVRCGNRISESHSSAQLSSVAQSCPTLCDPTPWKKSYDQPR